MNVEDDGSRFLSRATIEPGNVGSTTSRFFRYRSKQWVIICSVLDTRSWSCLFSV